MRRVTILLIAMSAAMTWALSAGAAPSALTGADGSISGRITDEFGDATPNGVAEVFTETEFIGAFATNANGSYDTGPLSAGTYYVFLYNGNETTFIDWFPEWYPNRPHLLEDQADPIVIKPLGGAVTGIDAQLEPLFDDMFDTVFTDDIGWLRGTGITKGCSTYLFCTEDAVNRGEMAAFLTRGLTLTDDGGGDLFVDDDNSTFEEDIDRLATAGVTRGCNPPTNNRFCPTEDVTRGAMAAFLVRAMGYTDAGGGDLFRDDDNSVFESDIDRLATAGVTRGCNPPTNDRFCPNDPVTRGAMAAFLHRALGGGVVFPASSEPADQHVPHQQRPLVRR